MDNCIIEGFVDEMEKLGTLNISGATKLEEAFQHILGKAKQLNIQAPKKIGDIIEAAKTDQHLSNVLKHSFSQSQEAAEAILKHPKVNFLERTVAKPFIKHVTPESTQEAFGNIVKAMDNPSEAQKTLDTAENHFIVDRLHKIIGRK